MVNAVIADDLVMHVAQSSAAIVLTKFSKNITVSAPEGLIDVMGLIDGHISGHSRKHWYL